MHKQHFWLFVLSCIVAVPASAGLFSDDEAREQIQQLEARLEQLEKSSNKLEEANKQQTGSMLDMLTQIESLNQELRRLRGQNEELEHNLQDAKNRQKDFYVDLDARIRRFEATEATVQSAVAQTADKSVAEDITVVEMLDKVAKDLGQLRNICVMENLYTFGIKTLTNAKCVEIKENAVVIEREGNREELPCNSVVVAIGAKSRSFDDISRFCEKMGIPYHVAGDAVRGRRALNAVAEASEIARRI